MVERSLFAMPQKDQEETRSRIFGDMRKTVEEPPAPVIDEVKAEPLRKEEPIVTAQPQKREEVKSVTPPSARASLEVQDEDDEAWGAIPSFLRRHKK
jgi:hypothetical protein